MYRLFILIFIFAVNTYASSVVEEFIKAQDWALEPNTVFKYQSIFKAKSKQQNIDSYSTIFTTKGSTAIHLIQHGRPTIFLSTPVGTWITQKNSPTPLKISGSYNVQGIMSVDDVVGIDYKNLYKVLKETSNIVDLQSISNNVYYPFVTITKISSKQFHVIFKDRNNVALKFGEYNLGTIDGIFTIKKAYFRDMIFDTNRTSSFEIYSIIRSKIPPQIFVPERMKLLFNQIK